MKPKPVPAAVPARRARSAGRLVRMGCVVAIAGGASLCFGQAPGPVEAAPANSAQELGRKSPPDRRVPRQLAASAALQGRVADPDGRGYAGLQVTLSGGGTRAISAITDADGIFRIPGAVQGQYRLTLSLSGSEVFRKDEVKLGPGEVLTVEIQLPTQLPSGPASVVPRNPSDNNESRYRELSRHSDNDGSIVPEMYRMSPDANVYAPMADRWNTSMPDYRRYADDNRSEYVLGHWYDPFNRNRFKGDVPVAQKVFGQRTFFNFTGSSMTAMDGRRLPTPANQSYANPGEIPFFGKGGQFFAAQTFRLSFDLFRGDAAFRPIDWQIRVTPAFNLNYLKTQENGIVNADVRAGIDRFDTRVGLQEAFVEVKLKDLSPNFDFVSVRAGIQQFATDFRGLIFADEQPGVRLFGNYGSNRFQYNIAFFDLLEKNTNSGLNTFHRRRRQVGAANLYVQDFFFKGYTAEFAYDYSNDDPTIHYNDNDFLVRPAPIGTIRPHSVHAHYVGWLGDGHIGRLNINHAFYEALGHDSFNPLAARKVDVEAQLAELELSMDRDWMRYRTSFLYASGDAHPRDAKSRVARGFDSIVDNESFAGGEFSFFNRESIRLTGTGVALNAGDSFLPTLRSDKNEGQSNFVNPGLYLMNAGADAKLTPTLKVIGNVNYLRFVRTEPLELLLFQNSIGNGVGKPVRHGIGIDSSIGVIWRPPLSDNIVITAGTAVLTPMDGLKSIYQSKVLLSGFASIRFQF